MDRQLSYVTRCLALSEPSPNSMLCFESMLLAYIWFKYPSLTAWHIYTFNIIVSYLSTDTRFYFFFTFDLFYLKITTSKVCNSYTLNKASDSDLAFKMFIYFQSFLCCNIRMNSTKRMVLKIIVAYFRQLLKPKCIFLMDNYHYFWCFRCSIYTYSI